MADNNFDKWRDNMRNMKADLEEQRRLQQELEKGLGGYYESMKKIHNLQKDITHLKEKELEETGKIKSIEKQLKDLNDKKKSGTVALTKEEKKLIKELNIELKYRQKNLEYLKEQTHEIEKQTNEIKKSVRQANLLKAGFKTTGKVIGWAVDKIKQSGIFEMDKEIRNAARSMGIGNKQYESFAVT